MSGTRAGALKGWETRRLMHRPTKRNEAKEARKQETTAAYHRVHETYGGRDEASRAARRMVKKQGSAATYTLWHDTEGWHIILYPDASKARSQGLI